MFFGTSTQLDIQYMFQNAHICTIYVSKKYELGTPFLTLIYTFEVSENGVKTTKSGNNIFFPFLHCLAKKEINQIQDNYINLIQRKKAQTNFLTKEIEE